MMVHTFFLPIFTAAKDEKYFNIKIEMRIHKVSDTIIRGDSPQ